MENFKKILSNCFLFKGISDDDISYCLEFNGYEEKEYSSGEIMQDAKSDKKIGIILSGKAMIMSGDDGVLIKKLSIGDIYGAAILFNNPKYLTQVIAVNKCKVLLIDKKFVSACMSYNSAISENYISYLAEKISFLNSKISSYTAKKTENKLFAYLTQLPREDSKVLISQDFATIARTIGIGRASLYRALEKLEKDGLIERKNKDIYIKEV